MFVLRLLGALLLIAATVALVYDGTLTLAGNTGFVTTSLGQHWIDLSRTSYLAAQGAVSRNLHPAIWDYGIQKVLALPAWFVLGLLGLGLYSAGRRKRRVNVFVN